MDGGSRVHSHTMISLYALPAHAKMRVVGGGECVTVEGNDSKEKSPRDAELVGMHPEGKVKEHW